VLRQSMPFEIKAPEVVHKNYSKDGTRKWVFRVGEGEGSLVETVLIPAEHRSGLRRTLCISSQVGCALDCSFCSTVSSIFVDAYSEVSADSAWSSFFRVSCAKNFAVSKNCVFAFKNRNNNWTRSHKRN
jgi:hypothetical protein